MNISILQKKNCNPIMLQECIFLFKKAWKNEARKRPEKELEMYYKYSLKDMSM